MSTFPFQGTLRKKGQRGCKHWQMRRRVVSDFWTQYGGFTHQCIAAVVLA